ncbi:MAG: glycosyl hydrolase [Alcaligenaceae bacterium]|nr:glycosyl hydrolase [Alcaligenaceae bacterium]
MNGTILVATAGQGILRSADNGTTWHRLGLKEAIEFDGVVRCLAVDPSNPKRIFAGADSGICVSEDGGEHFALIDSPANGMTVWSITVDPVNPDNIYAGTGAPSRVRIFRSQDGGKTWTQLPPDIPEFCRGVNRPRTLAICVDPTDNSRVWFGLEEGGAWESRDFGETWERFDTTTDVIGNPDIHAIDILPPLNGQPKTTFILTVNTVYRSQDDLQTWEGVPSKTRFDSMYYTRTIQKIADDSGALLIAIGDGTPGTRSRIYRSEDNGASWQDTVLHSVPNSTFWAFGAHQADPQLVFAGTKYGDLYRSTDAGKSWHKEWRSFSEITALAWTPFKADIIAHPQSIN